MSDKIESRNPTLHRIQWIRTSNPSLLNFYVLVAQIRIPVAKDITHEFWSNELISNTLIYLHRFNLPVWTICFFKKIRICVNYQFIFSDLWASHLKSFKTSIKGFSFNLTISWVSSAIFCFYIYFYVSSLF